MNAWLLLAFLQLPLSAQTVHIGVFTLFRPTEFRITPAADFHLAIPGAVAASTLGRMRTVLR